MEKKEKKHLKLTAKNILYYVEPEEQVRMVKVLEKYEEKIEHSRFKAFFNMILYSTKNDYFDKIDFLLDLIFDNAFESKDKQVIHDLLNDIQPVFEEAERNFWQKLNDLFSWS